MTELDINAPKSLDYGLGSMIEFLKLGYSVDIIIGTRMPEYRKSDLIHMMKKYSSFSVYISRGVEYDMFYQRSNICDDFLKEVMTMHNAPMEKFEELENKIGPFDKRDAKKATPSDIEQMKNCRVCEQKRKGRKKHPAGSPVTLLPIRAGGLA